MRQKMKRVLAGVLSACLMTGQMQVLVFASGEETTGENVYHDNIASDAFTNDVSTNEDITSDVFTSEKFTYEYVSEGDWEDGDRIKAQKANEAYVNNFGRFFAQITTNKYTGLTYTHNSVFDKCKVLHGVDVSKYQGDINWSKVKASGIEFAIIRVGCRGVETGDIYEDELYKQNIQGAIGAGIKVGVYIYSQAITPQEAIEEANFVLNRIKNYNITMPVVLDYEYFDGPGGRLYDAHLSKSAATAVCEAFADTVKKAGYTPMVYANANMLNNQLQADKLAKKSKIWLAHWVTDSSYAGTYDYWQYSSYGLVNGINTRVDCNFWYNPVSSKGLKLSATSKDLYVGDTYKMKGTITPSNSTDIITWTSSNPNVAYIDQEGNLVAGYRGSTTITGTTTSGISATCKISVYDKMSNYEIAPIKTKYTYDGITQMKPSITLRTKQTIALKGTVNTEVNLRNGPNTAYSLITTMPVGTDVVIYGTFKNGNSTWYSIRATIKGVTYRGYCAGAYITATTGQRKISTSYYSVSYANNINAGTKATVTATGKANGYLKGTTSTVFTIAPRSITEAQFDEIEDMNYTGNALTPGVAGTYNKMQLAAGKDYTLSYQNNINVGNGTVTIQGIGNYTGTVNKQFRIRGNRNYSIEAVADQVYTGSQITPDIILKDMATGETLTSGKDYKVTYQNNINIGTAKAIIQGMGQYDGTVEVSFQIVETAEDSDKKAVTIKNIPNLEYTGQKLEPDIEVLYDGEKLSREDYEVTYSDNLACGEATAVIQAKGQYTGTFLIHFDILRSDISSDAYRTNKVSDAVYTGAGITPQIILENAYGSLQQEKDYKITYQNNVNAGTAVITLQGIGSYTGMRTISFKITAKSMSGVTVHPIGAQVYTGSAISPATELYNGNIRLVQGKDYTVTYKNNINKGTATVTFSGIGNYAGTRTENYIIQARAIGSCTVSKVSDKQYTGKAITPAVTVKYGSRTLTKGKDYTIKYSANKNIGTATVTITGKGNFTGSRQISFSIVPKKVTGIGTSAQTKSSITLKWSSQSNVTGYEIYRGTAYDGAYKKIRTVANGKTKSYTNKGLSEGQEYYYKIRAYKIVNGKKYYGPFSGVLSRTTKRTGTQYAVTKGAVRLRKHAGTSYGDVIMVKKSTQLTLLAKTYDKKGTAWYKVKYKQSGKTYTGYIKAGWAKVEKPGKVTADVLTLRKSSSTSAAAKTYLSYGQSVRVLATKTSKKQKWYQVRVTVAGKTYTGYVLAKYIKLQ